MNLRRTPSLLVIVAMNLIPLYGMFFLGWTIFSILYFFRYLFCEIRPGVLQVVFYAIQYRIFFLFEVRCDNLDVLV